MRNVVVDNLHLMSTCDILLGAWYWKIGRKAAYIKVAQITEHQAQKICWVTTRNLTSVVGPGTKK